jgi:hypothetical protein
MWVYPKIGRIYNPQSMAMLVRTSISTPWDFGEGLFSDKALYLSKYE